MPSPREIFDLRGMQPMAYRKRKKMMQHLLLCKRLCMQRRRILSLFRNPVRWVASNKVVMMKVEAVLRQEVLLMKILRNKRPVA